MAAFPWDFTHDTKHTPWGGDTGFGDIIVLGKNWSAATFVWTFAATLGGAAVITLVNAAAGTQGVSATYDAAYVHPQTGQVVGATTIRPLITEATIEALTWPAVPASLVLIHDLLVTPSGAMQLAYAKGTMTITAGVGD